MSGEFFVVSVRQQALLATLRGYPSRLVDRLKRALDRLSVEVQSSVKGEKLSGQVLHRRTSTLERSINREVKVVPGAVVAIVGTNVEYGALHEYGASLIAHRKLRRPPRMITRKGGERVMTGSPYGLHFPERSFLRSTLKEYEDRSREKIRSAAIEALPG